MFLPGEGHGVFSFGAVRVGGKILRDLVLGRQANQTVGSDRNPNGFFFFDRNPWEEAQGREKREPAKC